LRLNFIHIEPVAETYIFGAVSRVSQFLEAFTILAVINEDSTVKVFPACSSTTFKGGIFSKVNFSRKTLGIFLDKNNGKIVVSSKNLTRSISSFKFIEVFETFSEFTFTKLVICVILITLTISTPQEVIAWS
jgi:hypothetical protein